MYDWYQNMIIQISVIDSTIPIYVSDGWDLGTTLEKAAPFALQGGRRNPIVVDTHKYYTFSEADKKRSPFEIIARIPTEVDEMKAQHAKACEYGLVDFIIGEWSCVLDAKSHNRIPESNRSTTVEQFGQMQCKCWQTCAAGSYFWTAKMDWMDGGEWGFVEMSKKGAIQAPAYMHWGFTLVRSKNARAQEDRLQLRRKDLAAHVHYWERITNGIVPEERRYEEGWEKGWWDASAFFLARAKGIVPGAYCGGDRIGLLALWYVCTRMDGQNMADAGQGESTYLGIPADGRVCLAVAARLPGRGAHV